MLSYVYKIRFYIIILYFIIRILKTNVYLPTSNIVGFLNSLVMENVFSPLGINSDDCRLLGTLFVIAFDLFQNPKFKIAT